MGVAAAAQKRLIIYPVGPLHNRPRILLLPIPSTSCTLVSSYCPLSPGLLQEPPNSSACDSPGSRMASPVLCSPQNCHSDPLNWKPVHTTVLFRTLSWLPVSLEPPLQSPTHSEHMNTCFSDLASQCSLPCSLCCSLCSCRY